MVKTLLVKDQTKPGVNDPEWPCDWSPLPASLGAAECLSPMPTFSCVVHTSLTHLLLPDEYLVPICDLYEE